MGLYRKVDGRLEQLSGANASGLPLGTIIAIYSNYCPTGFLPCNGQQFDKNQYPALFTLLGKDTLPDLREMTLVGIGESARVDIKSHDTYTLGQFKDDQIQNITGTFNAGSILVGNAGSTSGAFSSTHVGTWNVDSGGGGNYVWHFSFDASRNTRTGDVTHAKAVGVNYVIKAVAGFTELDVDTIYNQVVDYIENHAISTTFPGYTYIDNCIVGTRTISFYSDLLENGTMKFWKEFPNQAVGVWTFTNTGTKTVYVKVYGTRYALTTGPSSNHPKMYEVGPNGTCQFGILSDDPYTDLDSFAIEVELKA